MAEAIIACTECQNVVVISLHILNILGTNVGMTTGYPVRGLSWFFSPGRCWIVFYVRPHPFPSELILHNHHVICKI
jgi:hypothetical protein